MAEPGYFPLLIEGSWGPDPPKNLNTKLQMYFQSQKRSGGGECEVRPVPGSPARFLVLFHPQDGEGRLGRGREGTARSGTARPAPAAAAGAAEWAPVRGGRCGPAAPRLQALSGAAGGGGRMAQGREVAAGWHRERR